MLSKTSLKEVSRVFVGVFLLGGIMLIFFGVSGNLDSSAVLGALIGCCCTSFNFLILAITLERSLEKGNSAGAKVGTSYLLRLAITAFVIYFTIKAPYINHWATIIPLFFQSAVVIALSLADNRKGDLL